MFHSTEASFHHPGLVGAFEDTSALVQLCRKIPRSHGILRSSPQKGTPFFSSQRNSVVEGFPTEHLAMDLGKKSLKNENKQTNKSAIDSMDSPGRTQP